MKKFLAVVGLLTIVVATPACAQSFTAGAGTSNILPFAYKTQSQETAPAAYAQARRETPDRSRMSPAEQAAANHGNLGGSVVNGYVYDGD